MPYSSYVNEVRKRRCPCCGEERPIDWFVADRDSCWKCREMKKDAKEVKGNELIG